MEKVSEPNNLCNKKYSYFNNFAIKIAENGFTVTPTNGKKPIVRKWQNSKPTDLPWLRKVVARNRYPGANVGIVCGRVVAIDIDKLDHAKVEQIKKLATQHLGPTPFERIGRAPKTLLLYRPLDDIPAIKISGCIDVLSHGRQFVAYGIHPETGEPYRWLDSHHNPATAKLEELPPIKATDLRAFADAVCAALGWPGSGLPAPSLPAIKTALQTRQRTRQGEMLGGPLKPRIVRDGRGLVVDGREALLTSLTAAEYAKGFTTVDELVIRVWARFQADADLGRPKGSNPRKRWTYDDALAKARSTIRRKPDLRPPRRARGGHSASHLHAWRKAGYWTAEQRELHLAEVSRRIRTPTVLAVARVMIEALDPSGFCTLRIAEIAATASCSTKTVKDARAKLNRYGLWIRADGVYVPSIGHKPGLNRNQGSENTKRKQGY